MQALLDFPAGLLSTLTWLAVSATLVFWVGYAATIDYRLLILGTATWLIAILTFVTALINNLVTAVEDYTNDTD